MRLGSNPQRSWLTCARGSSRFGAEGSSSAMPRRGQGRPGGAALHTAAFTEGAHMRTRRIMAVVVLIVGSGSALHMARAQQAGGNAQAQQVGAKRTELQR